MLKPTGVETFDRESAIRTAKKNMVITVFGDSKTGKTHFAIRCARPLYLAYLDPRPDIHQMLLKAESEGYEGPVELLVIPPIPYKDLSRYEAEARVRKVEAFGEWAREQAAGGSGGTFVLDGGTMFRGYLEKALIGESQTLGWRAEKGERGGPSRFDSVKSNSAMRDFVGQFAGSALDVIFVWEGRQIYSNDQPTSRYKTTMPKQVPFALNAQVETLVVLEPVVVNQQQVGYTAVPEIRIDWNSYDLGLYDRRLPAMGFDALKRLFLVDVPAGTAEESLLVPGNTYTRANNEGLGWEATSGGEEEEVRTSE